MYTPSIQPVEKYNEEVYAKGYIFACTNKTERECFEHMIFSSNKLYAENVLRIAKGDLLFLFNIDKDQLCGLFKAKSEGKKNIIPEAWEGKYPYQVEVEKVGEIKIIKNAKKNLSQMGINWGRILNKGKLDLLLNYIQNPEKFDWNSVKKEISADEEEQPRSESTTLWDHPKQSYGKTPKGNNRYPGVTPAFIIYNMIKRYTEPGDLVVDPMAGSGTTLD
ncbi:MAG TPA: DNA methylase, partial [Elusimicrobia bacterium]|nr:DNA methylase [Elusimicrobiota bacterium]